METSEQPPAPAAVTKIPPPMQVASEDVNLALTPSQDGVNGSVPNGVSAAPHQDAVAQPVTVADTSADLGAAVAGASPEAQAPIIERPIEHTAPGISSVADFLPSSESQEKPASPPAPSPAPVLPAVADGQMDTTMTDAVPASDAPTSTHAPVSEVTPELPPELPVVASVESAQQHIPLNAVDTAPQTADVPAPFTVDAPQPSLPTEQQVKPDPADNLGVDAKPSSPISAQTPTESFPAFSESNTAQTAQVDVAMQEAPQEPVKEELLLSQPVGQPVLAQPSGEQPSTGVTRPREEDEDVMEEPTAKRTRVEESAVESPVVAPVAEDFKRPELPVVAQSVQPAQPAEPTAPAAAPATNGSAMSHLPARRVFSTDPLNGYQKKVLEDKLKNTKKVKSAIPFLRPVDPVELNIPNYPNVIKNPMDIGTMEAKLKADQYNSLEDFVADFELIVNNCFTFNGPAHSVSIMAQNLRAYFLKQMDHVPLGTVAAPLKPAKKESSAAKPQPRRESRASIGGATAKQSPPAGDTFALLPGGTPQIRRDSNAGRPKRAVVPPPSRDLPYSGSKPKRKENMAGLKFCEHVLEELRKPRYSQMTQFFVEPVDPVALNIPHYFKIIKTPMDIQNITSKMRNNQYSTAEEFKADFDLMFDNCFKFNPADNLVHVTGKQFQSEFDALWKSKNEWIKKNQPRSQRVTPVSDDSESEESSEEEADAVDDEKEATIRALKEQLATMQNMLGAISGSKRDSPKASSKKKSRSSGAGKAKKGSSKEAKASSKSKQSKKQRLVTYEEKQEISTATENMTEAQLGKLTNIITENVSKYKDMAGDDVELEIDDLPNEVQHKLLKYVRSIFPRQRDDGGEDLGLDDEYEPRGAKAGGTKKKHKPMKKAEADRRIAELKSSMDQMRGVTQSVGAVLEAESSGDDDSESSEEE